MTGDADGPRVLGAFVPKLPAPPETLDAQLESVTERALAKAQDILGRPFDPDNGILARAQTAVIASALTTQVRVDESKLRMRETDGLGKLLEIISKKLQNCRRCSRSSRRRVSSASCSTGVPTLKNEAPPRQHGRPRGGAIKNRIESQLGISKRPESR